MPLTQALIIDSDGLDAADIAAIDSFVQARRGSASPEADEPRLGWTRPSAAEFLVRLASDPRGRVRLRVLAAAVNGGGFVDRETVYELGEYRASRSLKGFTRPIRRHMRAMQDEGRLRSDAVLPLEPVYDPNVASYQQTSGFRLPPSLIELFTPAVG